MRTPKWQRRYVRKVLWTDVVIVLVSLAVSLMFRVVFTFDDFSWSGRNEQRFIKDYTLITLIIAGGWLALLAVFDTRDPRVFAIGPDEYKRVINATLTTFGVFSIIMFAAKADTGRGHLLVALPAGLLLLLIGRWVWRSRLFRRRRQGKNLYRTLVAGEQVKSIHTAQQLKFNTTAGYRVMGVVTDAEAGTELKPGLTAVGHIDRLLETVDEYQPDTLILTSADWLTPERMKRIGWELESRKVGLVVTAALTDIAGPRMHNRPVSGFPLIHVESPEFSGMKFFVKRMFDLIVAALVGVLLLPFMAVIALIIRIDSKGPVIYRQQRMGLNGKPFTMLKFRTMQEGTHTDQLGLLDRSDGFGPLFKMKQDPRVTKVGGFLRRHSIDELPQLWNVIRGDMSLVGPRPPLHSEVEQYDRWAFRRLLVKPGMSGLWQVNGRSDLDWEESVRLDLFYVENWSLVGDVLILWRTIRVVFKGIGAY